MITPQERTQSVLIDLDNMLANYGKNANNHEKVISSLKFLANELDRETLVNFIKYDCEPLEYEEMIIQLLDEETIFYKKIN